MMLADKPEMADLIRVLEYRARRKLPQEEVGDVVGNTLLELSKANNFDVPLAILQLRYNIARYYKRQSCGDRNKYILEPLEEWHGLKEEPALDMRDIFSECPALFMTFGLDMKQHEISEQLGIPLGSVSKRIRTELTKAKEMLCD